MTNDGFLRFKAATASQCDHLGIEPVCDRPHAILVKSGQWGIVEAPVQQVVVRCVAVPIPHTTHTSKPVVEGKMNRQFHPMTLRLHIAEHWRRVPAYAGSHTPLLPEKELREMQ